MSREQKFWGWGEAGAGPRLPDHAAGLLREWLGVSGAVVAAPVALADVRLRAAVVSGELRAALERAVGAEHVRDDREIRALRAAGKSYLDLLALRSGAAEDAPDVVVAPADHGQVEAVLRACAEAGAAVIPFGGGTSVVGGVAPRARAAGRRRSRSTSAGSTRSSTSTSARASRASAPGCGCPSSTTRSAPAACTLGHVPQSYEWATVGGCAATRSAGQASTGFGRFDELVASLRCATPAGELATLDRARRAPPGPTCARSCSARRARSARSPSWCCACGRSRPSGATRRGCCAPSTPAARRCARSPRRRSRPTWRASPTRTRRARRSRSPAPAGPRGARAASRCGRSATGRDACS